MIDHLNEKIDWTVLFCRLWFLCAADLYPSTILLHKRPNSCSRYCLLCVQHELVYLSAAGVVPSSSDQRQSPSCISGLQYWQEKFNQIIWPIRMMKNVPSASSLAWVERRKITLANAELRSPGKKSGWWWWKIKYRQIGSSRLHSRQAL